MYYLNYHVALPYYMKWLISIWSLIIYASSLYHIFWVFTWVTLYTGQIIICIWTYSCLEQVTVFVWKYKDTYFWSEQFLQGWLVVIALTGFYLFGLQYFMFHLSKWLRAFLNVLIHLLWNCIIFWAILTSLSSYGCKYVYNLIIKFKMLQT